MDENDKSVVAALLILVGMSLIVGMMVTVPLHGSWLSGWQAPFAGAAVLAGAVIVILAVKWF